MKRTNLRRKTSYSPENNSVERYAPGGRGTLILDLSASLKQKNRPIDLDCYRYVINFFGQAESAKFVCYSKEKEMNNLIFSELLLN